MSGDASTPEQDQTVESGAVPATPESAPDAPEATSEQAPAAVDPADRMQQLEQELSCLLYTSPSPRDATLSRMPSSA